MEIAFINYQLKLSVEKQGDYYVADIITLPGMPPVGKGKSVLEAIGDLMVNLAINETYREYHNFILADETLDDIRSGLVRIDRKNNRKDGKREE